VMRAVGATSPKLAVRDPGDIIFDTIRINSRLREQNLLLR